MQDKLVYPQNEIIQSKMLLMSSLRHAGLESKDISVESIIRGESKRHKISFVHSWIQMALV